MLAKTTLKEFSEILHETKSLNYKMLEVDLNLERSTTYHNM